MLNLNYLFLFHFIIIYKTDLIHICGIVLCDKTDNKHSF